MCKCVIADTSTQTGVRGFVFISTMLGLPLTCNIIKLPGVTTVVCSMKASHGVTETTIHSGTSKYYMHV